MSNKEDFAAARSHQNASLGYDYAKAAAQAAILINGGAATAILGFMSGANGAALLRVAPFCLMTYALGVVAASWMTWALFQSNHNWNIFWQSVVLHDREDTTAKDRAEDWRWWADKAFLVTMACFVTASFGLGLGFLVSNHQLAERAAIIDR
jgi:hypothetical protein